MNEFEVSTFIKYKNEIWDGIHQCLQTRFVDLGTLLHGFAFTVFNNQFLFNRNPPTRPWTPPEAVLDIFRTNDQDPALPDIYRIEAGHIYEKDPADVDKDERQVGKVAVLALGFGGGVGALSAMATGYGLSLDPALQKHIVTSWRGRR